jgi:hypothetical protein
MSKLWRRLRVLFRRERFEDELEEEMPAHLEMQAEENREKSMEAKEVRYASRMIRKNPGFAVVVVLTVGVVKWN